MTPPTTLHIVEPDPAERASLAALLSTAGYETKTYGSAEMLIAADGDTGAAEHAQRAAIIADMSAPDDDGAALLKRIRESDGLAGRLPVVLVAAHVTAQQIVRAVEAGAVDVLEKPLDDRVLFAAVARGLDRFNVQLAEAGARSAARRRLQALLPRERDVLKRLLVRGSNKAIASDLGLSPRTVEVYRARIMAKTKAESLPELVRVAIAAGLADRDAAALTQACGASRSKSISGELACGTATEVEALSPPRNSTSRQRHAG